MADEQTLSVKGEFSWHRKKKAAELMQVKWSQLA
jgi:hypothetical protein